MGKIIYKCMIDPFYLEKGPNNQFGFLTTTKLPKSLQQAVKAKNLDGREANEKLKKYFYKKFPDPSDKKSISFNIFKKIKPAEKPVAEDGKGMRSCWLLTVEDTLGKGVKVVRCKEAIYNVDSSEKNLRVVNVSCEFTKRQEVTVFLFGKIPDLEKFEIIDKKVSQIKADVEKQMEKYPPPQGRLDMDGKVKVKINYDLKY